jgi:hypothetical protein
MEEVSLERSGVNITPARTTYLTHDWKLPCDGTVAINKDEDKLKIFLDGKWVDISAGRECDPPVPDDYISCGYCRGRHNKERCPNCGASKWRDFK